MAGHSREHAHERGATESSTYEERAHVRTSDPSRSVAMPSLPFAAAVAGWATSCSRFTARRSVSGALAAAATAATAAASTDLKPSKCTAAVESERQPCTAGPLTTIDHLSHFFLLNLLILT